MYVPIAEIKTAGRKKSTRARRKLGGVPRACQLSSAILLAFAIPDFAAAEVVAANNKSAVIEARTGVPVINIAAPNAQGLSHTQLQQLNVMRPGVVFNNSLHDGQSHIAGRVLANPNLSGHAAKSILAEVTGTSPSSLAGTLEVFGNKADLIVANPNGITVNGLTTLNAGSLTLTTGVPTVRGGSVSLAVDKGRLTVGDEGVNTDGLKTFDMVAKLIQIDGAIGSSGQKSDIKAIAGTSVFDTATRTHTAKTRVARAAAQDGGGYAIDGSAAGAMHGKAITLIATDAGLGVRQPGSLSSENDISVQADGNIQVGKTQGKNISTVSGAAASVGTAVARQNLTLKAQSGLSIDAFNVKGDANLQTVSGVLWLGPETGAVSDGKSSTGGRLSVAASDGGVVVSRYIDTDSLELKASNVHINHALIDVKGSEQQPATIDVSGSITMAGTLSAVRVDGETINNASITLENGVPVVRDGLTGQALPGAEISSDAGIRAHQGDIQLKAGSLHNNGGMLLSAHGLEVKATSLIENKGILRTKNKLALSGQNIDNAFAVLSDQDVQLLAAGKFSNTGTVLADKGALLIGANASINNQGVLNAGGRLTLGGLAADAGQEGSPDIVSAGRILSDGLTVSGRQFDNQGKLTVRGGGVSIKVEDALRSTGEVQVGVGSDVQATANTIHLGGKFVSLSKVSLSAAGDTDIDGKGRVSVKQLSLSTHNLHNTGSVSISGAGNIQARGSVENLGKLQGVNLTLEAQHLDNKGSSAVLRGTRSLDATVKGDVNNEGRVESQALVVQAQNLRNQAEATIIGNKGATLKVAEQFRNGGTIRSNAGLTVSAGSLDNLLGAKLQADTATFDVRDQMRNAGEVLVKQQLSVKAAELDNAESGSISASDAGLNASALNNAGKIAAVNDIVSNIGDYRNTGHISAGANASFTVTNTDGLEIDPERKAAVANGTLTYEARSLRVRDAIQNPGNIVLKATQGDIDNDNQIVTPQNLTLTAQGDIINEAGALMWAGQNISLSGRNINNERDAWIMTQDGDITLQGSNRVRNRVGRIDAGNNLVIDAPRTENLSELSGEVGGFSPDKPENVVTQKNLGHWRVGRWVRTKIDDFSVRRPMSTLSVKQGLMLASGDIHLNQHEQKGQGSQIYNEGIVLAGKVLKADGSTDNRSLSKPLNVIDFFKQNVGGHYVTSVVDSLALANVDERAFPSLYDLLDFVFSDPNWWVTLFVAYGYHPADVATVLMSADMTHAPEFNKMLNHVMGSDWRALDATQRHVRWTEAKAGKRAAMDFYPDAQTVMAGRKGVEITGGKIMLGGNATQSASEAQLTAAQRGHANIGKADVAIVTGTLDAVFASGDGMSYVGKDDLISQDPVLQELLGNRFVFGRAPDKLAAQASEASGDALPKPYYETRLAYIDQGQFYGSSYFFQQVGYQPHQGVRVLGDNYFDTQMIQRERARLLAGAEGRDILQGASLVKAMMDNAAAQAGALGLKVGEALTEKQISGLENDIVWYVWANIEGKPVMVPRVYLAKQSKKAAEDSRKRGGAVIASAGAINAKTNGADVAVYNAVFMGDAGVHVDARGAGADSGNIAFTSTGGVLGGAFSKENVDLHGQNIRISGGAINAKRVTLDAKDKLEIIVGMTHDDKGRLVRDLRADQVNGQQSVNLSAKAITTEGATIASQGSVSLKADNVHLGDVKEVGSEYRHTVHNGLGEFFSFLSQTNTIEKSAQANSAGTDISTKALKINTTGDLTVTGGNVQATNSDIDVGGNLKLEAGKNDSYHDFKEDKRQILVGMDVGAGGYSASAGFDTEDGLQTYAGRAGPNSGGATFNLGASISSEKETRQAETYSNGVFNVGNGLIKVGSMADIGGADINNHRAGDDQSQQQDGGLSLTANEIKTTKYVDKEKRDYSKVGFSVGYQAYAKSSLLTTSSRFGDMIAQTVDDPKRKVDPALAAAMAATEATQLLFDDTVSAGEHVGADVFWQRQSSTHTKENTQRIGGNVSFNATKGDIDLVGTQFSGGNKVELDARGDVSLRAAKSTTTSSGEDHRVGLDVGRSYGVNAPLRSAGAGIWATLSGTHLVSHENSTTYENATLGAQNIDIKAGKNLGLIGATVKADHSANVVVGGDTTIKSLQNDIKREANGGNWAVGAVISVNSNTLVSASASLGGSAEHHHDNARVVTQQAGITAGGPLTLKTGGSLGMTGSHLVSSTKEGHIGVGGSINATKLHDKIDKDGGKGGANFAVNPTTGLPMVNFEYGRDARDHVESTNNVVINVGTKARGGVHGSVSTDPSKEVVVTREEYYAGGESVLSVPTSKPKFLMRERKNKIDPSPPPPPPKVKKVDPPPKDEVDGPKPAPKPKAQPRPSPSTARYEVQKQVKDLQGKVSAMNLMKDGPGGKLQKPVTLTVVGPDGPTTVVLKKRGDVMKLDGFLMMSSPAQGAKQELRLKIIDEGGQNYRVTYRSVK